MGGYNTGYETNTAQYESNNRCHAELCNFTTIMDHSYAFHITWSIAFGLLSVQGFISTNIFYNNRKKLYSYYALYCLVAAGYLLLHFKPFRDFLRTWITQNSFDSFNWYIQTVYYNFLVLFALEFLEIKKYRLTLYKVYLLLSGQFCDFFPRISN